MTIPANVIYNQYTIKAVLFLKLSELKKTCYP